MNGVLLSSSVLIAALLVLRQVFRQKISRRVQYALWGLVLLRLLVPVSLPAVHFSVLSAAEPVVEALDSQSIYLDPAYERAWYAGEAGDSRYAAAAPYRYAAMAPASQDNARVFTDGNHVTHRITYSRQVSLKDFLRPIWAAGAGLMALWILASNLRFWLRLRQRRLPLSLPGCRCRVFLMEGGLGSPCLFGLFRPAIYLTPAAMATDASLRHVLAHEATHARHLDPLWSLLRSVCLALYWFNPLVWAAAWASRTDCELACDEGALEILGEAERIPYGQTLLQLIPVRRTPGSPVLTATTMTAGKRRLRERITRIAERRQTRTAALCAALSLAALVCACTFTGAEPTGSRPLTADELAYFNGEFFNGEAVNLHNQFLSSTYEAPAGINLYELVYCGVPEQYGDPDKLQADGDTILNRVYGGQWPDCAVYEMTTAQLDGLLLDCMGVVSSETDRVGLENFIYLADYDTYYWAHGDTNYRGEVSIAAGERKGGDICLYYDDTYYAEGWKCATLQDNGSGGYWFRSNLPCDRPAHLLGIAEPQEPAPQPAGTKAPPEGELVLTIPLTDLEPYQPEDFRQMEPDEVSADTMGEVLADQVLANGKRIVCYQALEDADIKYWAVRDGDTLLRFCREEAAYTQGYGAYEFMNLFGHDGFVLCAPRGMGYNALDYYYFDETGIPRLLAGCANEATQADWDGNGVDELAWNYHTGPYLYFQREGEVYLADINALATAAWPEASYLSFGWPTGPNWHVPLAGIVTTEAGGTNAAAFRELYFDGENLLFYKRDRTASGHLSPGVNGPDEVIATLKGQLQELFDDCRRRAQENPSQPDYDDWRIESLAGPFYEQIDGAIIEVYRYNYELHTTTPDKVMVAGGMYLDEDGWRSPGYPNCEYLYFLLSPEGELEYLYADMQNDCGPGDEFFRESLSENLQRLGVTGAAGGADIPRPVREAALAAAHDARERWQYDGQTPLEWVDQRLTRLELVDPSLYGKLPEGLRVEVYDFAYELQAANPGDVVLAGGTYVTEDGWVGGWSDETHMLVFQVQEDGSCVQLASRIPSDVFPESLAFPGSLAWTLVQGGVMEPSETSAQALYYRLYEQPFTFLDELSAYPLGEQTAALEKLLSCPEADQDLAEGKGLLWDAIHSVQQGGGAPQTEGQQAALLLLLERIEGRS